MANPVRVVVFAEGDKFIAQCLEVDICAQGDSADEALNRVHVAFEAETRLAQENGTDVFDIGPAPAPFHAMYNSDVVNRTEMAA